MNTAPAQIHPSSNSAFNAELAGSMEWLHSVPPSVPDSGWLPCAEAEENLFARLKAAYAGAGGFASVEQLAALAERRALGDIASVKKMVASRKVIVLRTQDTEWIPVFQIERETLAPKEHVRRVIAELRPAFDDWGIAQWFTENNAWLRHRSPLSMINRDLGEVMNAARADCFVAGS